MNNESFSEEAPLRHELDAEILMQRDVHFGGSFQIMIDYYKKGGKGVCSDFDLSYIERLSQIEQSSKTNLAAEILSGGEAEKIKRAKDAYKKLRDLYENKSLANKIPLLIADLILSEELEPGEEIQAIVQEKGEIVPALLELLRAQDFYDPLFPGYGYAPSLAAHCLGLIGDKRAIISLFEAIGEEDFFNEDILLESLKRIGEPAKDFLLHVVKGRPLNFDNERAAIALIRFKEDPEVAKECLHLLLEEEVRKNQVLSTYLIFCCEGLKDPELQKSFQSLADDAKTPSWLKKDIRMVAGLWKK